MDQAYPQIVTERRVVKNQQPYDNPTPYRIAIIGEAPGEDEENYGVPFVGRSGQHLDRELRSVGIDRNRCFVGNVCQVRPPGNKIELFSWDGPEIQDGLAQLSTDLATFSPNLCLLLGNTPLRAARGPSKITKWRGSLFTSNTIGPFFGRKCLPSIHPAAILREFEWNPLARFDLSRARAEGETSALHLPQRELITNWSASQLCHAMDNWTTGQRCSVDIEGGLPNWAVNDGVRKDSKKRRHIGWRCVSLSGRPTKAFAIAWWKFNDEDHGRLLQSFARLMARPDVPKVLQNSLYDSFVLGYGYAIEVVNVAEDTMLKGWEVYCELPKSLSVQASLYTREPHWKDEDMYESTGEALAVGCCKDTSVTLEICEAQDTVLVQDRLAYQHYRTNMELLNPALYMEYRGILYDTENVRHEKEERTKEVEQVGEGLCRVAGSELRGAKGSLSSQRLAKCLYETKGYPPQYVKEAGRKTNKVTTDIEALLALRKKLPGDEFLNGIIRHRHLEGLIETLNIKPDADGRVRCAYNVVGTETGRFSCKTSPTGAGANMTTITKKLRKNYIADPGYEFFQCDLAGADGWTVAAQSARLGDDTMLQDYYAGLKPAKLVILLNTFGLDVNLTDRESLAWWSKARKNKTDPLLPFDIITELYGGPGIYECTKQVSHGSNYLMGIPTMQTLVMKKSFKETGVPLYMDHSTARALQQSYFARYKGVLSWHNWCESKLVADGKITSCSGNTRIFFGRRFGKDIHETVKQFLAQEPQHTTTWSTNLAMLNLWKDPENRRGGLVLEAHATWRAQTTLDVGSLIIEPLHQVHDALCGQWPRTCRDWASAKVRSYFNNPLTIAGTTLTIPFDGAFGPSWGDTPNTL